MENITPEKFKSFIKELIDIFDYDLDLNCPFNSRENEWFDEDGWKGKDFCDVTFTKDYFGEVDQECTGLSTLCWIFYTLDMFEIKYDKEKLLSD